MTIVGLVVTLIGFLIAAASVGITSSVGARMALVLAGIVISLFGIVGVINRGYLSKAIWRR
jgi:hypothetical protein